MHRAKYGEGGGAPMPSGRATLPKSPRVPQPRSSLNPHPLGFYGSFD